MSGSEECAQIYALLCPIVGDVRYIGKAKNADKRLASHFRDARRRVTPVYSWINKLAKKHLKPVLIVLEDAENWEVAEKEWIADARINKCRLLNLADGGNQPKSNLEARRRAAKTMNAKRPHNVMIALRLFESGYASAKKHWGECSEAALLSKGRIDGFKELIAFVRTEGWLEEYDRRLGERFPSWRHA